VHLATRWVGGRNGPVTRPSADANPGTDEEKEIVVKLYIYNIETSVVAAVIEGGCNAECEKVADGLNYDHDLYGWVYNDHGLVFSGDEPAPGEVATEQFYLINHKYVGPNQDTDRYVDADTIEIGTTPARTNSSKEVRTEGWCGTTNDWALYAHGEYDSLEAARAAIAEIFGDVRERDPNGEEFSHFSDGTVAVFKPGKHEPMSRQTTADWSYPGIRDDITADTTDERIAELVKEYEGAANAEGYTLDSDLDVFMKARRQELSDERYEDKDGE